MTLNGEGMRPEALRAEQQRLRWGLGIPVVRPLRGGRRGTHYGHPRVHRERGQRVKILRATSAVEDFALTRPYAIAGQDPIASVGNVVVRIEGEGGLVGLGAASPGEHVTGETLEACRAAIATDRLAWLVGRGAPAGACRCSAARRPRARPGRPRRAPRSTSPSTTCWRSTSACRSSRCWAGRTGSCRPRSRSASSRSPRRWSKADVGRGFRVLKVKIGDALDVDLERLRRLRDALGPSVTIRVDANIGYTVEETARFFSAPRSRSNSSSSRCRAKPSARSAR